MEEIEVKILDIDKEEITRKLLNFGANKIFSDEVNTSYWDFEDGSLSQKKITLRLRRNGDRVVFASKEKISKETMKIMEEHEVEVKEEESLRNILKSLGLKVIGKQIKNRTSFALGGVRFEIDTLPDIPTFLEIEAPTQEKVLEWIEKLGFSKEDAKPWTGNDVLKHYGKTENDLMKHYGV